MGLGNELLYPNLSKVFGSYSHVLSNRIESLYPDHIQRRGLHKDVHRGVGAPMEPLRGEGDDPYRVSALPRIRQVGRLTRHEISSLCILKGEVLAHLAIR